MSARILTNADVLAGAGTGKIHSAYRELVAAHGHDELCDAYALDRDAVNGGTYWVDVVRQALAHGDMDPETGELT